MHGEVKAYRLKLFYQEHIEKGEWINEGNEYRVKYEYEVNEHTYKYMV